MAIGGNPRAETPLINTPLRRRFSGVQKLHRVLQTASAVSEPVSRLMLSGKPLKRFGSGSACATPSSKLGVNESRHWQQLHAFGQILHSGGAASDRHQRSRARLSLQPQFFCNALHRSNYILNMLVQR